MGLKLFLHGVPDTPAMWGPLLSELALPPEAYRAPAMPGFVSPAPAAFSSTKDAYVDWFVAALEQAHTEDGPVDLVGHDWGAILVVRAASLRPDLVRSWCVANALPHPDYRWHRMAKIWQTPLLGELAMFATRKEALCKGLHAAGLPADLASTEASHWSPSMKRAILKLYRSARTVGTEWWDDTADLPSKGMVFWGADDPYVPSWVAETFCDRTGAALEMQSETGHWSIVERADVLAGLLKTHWT